MRFYAIPHNVLMAAVMAVLTVMQACVTPEGEGIVAGQIYLLNCSEGDHYGTPDRMAYFDLHADFFAGEIIHDERVLSRMNRLDIRLQKGTGQLGDADLLFIQIPDVRQAAEYFVSSRPIPVTPDGVARASLGLYLTCPSFYDGPEAIPDATDTACPQLTPDEVADICSTVDYGSLPYKYTPQAPFSEGQSCLILCRFGDLSPGDFVPDDFKIDYKDTVAGVYFLSLKPRRDDTLDGSPLAGGFVQGNFRIRVIRAKAVQTFP